MMEVKDIIGNLHRIVLCGIGNERRGDYGFGAYLAEALLRAIENPNFFPVNCHDIPEGQAGIIVRFRPELVIIATPLEMETGPGTVVAGDPWEALGDVPEELKPQLEVTLNHLREILPWTRFVFLGCQPGSEKKVTEEIKECVRALALAFKDVVD